MMGSKFVQILGRISYFAPLSTFCNNLDLLPLVCFGTWKQESQLTHEGVIHLVCIAWDSYSGVGAQRWVLDVLRPNPRLDISKSENPSQQPLTNPAQTLERWQNAGGKLQMDSSVRKSRTASLITPEAVWSWRKLISQQVLGDLCS